MEKLNITLTEENINTILIALQEIPMASRITNPIVNDLVSQVRNAISLIQENTATPNKKVKKPSTSNKK
jgi:hypothetical protein